MANVEIDESELANLRRVAQAAEVVSKHPKARAMMQEAVALAAPDMVGPETRLRSEFSEGLASLKDELRADREAREKHESDREEKESLSRLEGRWAKGRALARESGYDGEGLDALENWMQKEGVADHRIAIPAFERENPPPEPLMTGGTRWNFFDQPKDDISLKPLFEGNDDAFLGPAIAAALKEARGR